MSAAVYPFLIEVNADFSYQLTWTDQNGVPINLTGYSAGMEIANFAKPVLPPEPNCVPCQCQQCPPIQTVYATLSSTGENPGITFDALNGIIYLFIPAATTATYDFSNAVYDLLLLPAGGQVRRLLQGPVQLSPGVTTLS